MTKFEFSIDNPNQQYIQISVKFIPKENKTYFHLPSWRPGRYELGNFAKNVKKLAVYQNNKAIPFIKITKDSWEIENELQQEIEIRYFYYASELNAGSTYLDNEQLYVNPVNCCIYIKGFENEAHQVKLNIPESYQIACGLNADKNCIVAKTFDELADSPFIASKSLQHNKYVIGETIFHLWFQGEVKVDWKKIITDFTLFTTKQIEKFGEFPVKEYHFLFQIVPYRAYHGVEHQTSTVILLGPSYDIFSQVYTDLLGVSSHELYHTWNVKSIRPIEMWPYDFTKENYSELGYLCEGVTTYMGDLFLYKSGVFDLNQYCIEFNQQLQKHFDNFARFNYSVTDSSFDTWLDGYVPGAPNRKVSIYTEGCLLAFVTDCFVMKHSKEKYNLDDVMKRLYYDFYLNNKGVSSTDYLATIERLAGKSFQDIFTRFFKGTEPFENILVDALEYIGFELQHKASSSASQALLGIKTLQNNNNFIIKSIYPGSVADMGGLMLEDEIIAINDFLCNGELDKWINHFEENEKTISVKRKGKLLHLTMPTSNRNYYLTYNISKVKEPNHAQQKAFERWKS